MICKNCKQEIPEKSSFCPYCGVKVITVAYDGKHSQTGSETFRSGAVEKKKSKIRFSRMLPAMLMMMFVLFVLCFLKGDFQGVGSSTFVTLDRIGTHLVYQLLCQIFPFITCWAFVLRKGKSDKDIWINYILWTVFFSIAPLIELGILPKG